MKTAAELTSKILNPFLTVLLTIFLVVSVQQIETNEKMLWIFAGLVLSILPAAIIYLQYKRGKISSLWSPSAKERQLSFLVWVVLAAILAAGSFWLSAPRSILALSLVLLILGVINLLLTGSFKISIHSEMVTLMALVALLSVSVELFYLVLLIPLVSWARIYLKHHSLSEVAYGSLLSIVVIYFVFSYFGLATF